MDSPAAKIGAPSLQKIQGEHVFNQPAKNINEGSDVDFFLSSKAYKDIVTWLLMLNASMFPRNSEDGKIQSWPTGMPATDVSPMVSNLKAMIAEMDAMIDQCPPDTGPRRFGNVAFRSWYAMVESRLDGLLEKYLPVKLRAVSPTDVSPLVEIKAYLSGSWGSAQRLDYGTGHELSFLAFLACLWKLDAFEQKEEGIEERAIVLHVVHPYLQLVRRLIKSYTLEPAGSHGVWGLDDHSFVPYIFGSAQLAPAITDSSHIPTEGSAKRAPDPTSVMKPASVEVLRETNLYFDAIGFIYDVKKGPFWEHSPVLYDISGVKAGWAKINKGMIKMYLAEVLAKFPVVQHFPFGSLFEWERDPEAKIPPSTVHSTAHPPSRPQPDSATSMPAPWAKPTSRMPSTMYAPTPRTSMPLRPANGATANNEHLTRKAPSTNDEARGTTSVNISLTKAPWAK